MPEMENLESVRKSLAKFNASDLEGYLEIFDRALIFHGFSQRLKPGVAGLKDYYTDLRKAFPDMRLTSEDLLADGEKVAHRYTFYGTHKGEYLGAAPTMKLVVSPGIIIHQFRDGKIVETWNSSDGLNFLRQLGVASPLTPK